jgi:hypothetical protein
VNGKLDVLAASFSSTSLQSSSNLSSYQIDSTQQCTNAFSSDRTKQLPLGRGHLRRKIITQTSIDAGLGALRIRSTSAKILSPNGEPCKDDDDKHNKKSYVIQLILGFTTCRKGFRISTSSGFDNWTFNTIRRRSSSDEIFQFCEDGNTERVWELLRYGEASVFDVDENGQSLLHVRYFLYMI